MIAVKVLVILGSLAILFCVAGWHLCDFDWSTDGGKIGFSLMLIIIAMFNVIAICIL